MLEKRETVNTGDLLTLLTWLKGESTVLDNKFGFDYLLNECGTGVENVDVTGFFDQLMYDLYHIYEKLEKLTPEDLEAKVVNNPMFNILPKDVVEESMRSMDSFMKLYEELIMNSKFEEGNIRAIQKKIMDKLFIKFVATEEYEKCGEIKQKLTEI